MFPKYTFEGTSPGFGPSSTTLTFARIVFSTNRGNLPWDGNDIFSGVFEGQVFGGNAPGSDITSRANFGGASVWAVPEPGSIFLLGLGLALLTPGLRKWGCR